MNQSSVPCSGSVVSGVERILEVSVAPPIMGLVKLAVSSVVLEGFTK